MILEKQKNSDISPYNILITILLAILSIMTITFHINQTKINNRQDSLFNDMYYSVIDTFEKDAFLVTVTTFNPVKGQTDKDPSTAASGFKIDINNPFKQRVVGLSRDLLEEFMYGERVLISNCGKFNGVYTVVDCAHPRFIRTVDICIGKQQLGGKFRNAVIEHYD